MKDFMRFKSVLLALMLGVFAFNANANDFDFKVKASQPKNIVSFLS